MTIETWLAYSTLMLVVCITPGPAVILTSVQSAARGFGAGLSVIAGVQVGNMIYFLLSAFGVGAMIAASAMAFLVIKWAGAAYLLFLGVRALLARPAEARPGQARQLSRHAFVQGLANQLANPKSILFYAAILPQFIDTQGTKLVESLAILAATGVAIEVPVLAAFAAAAARGGTFVGHRGSRWRERLTGSALIAAAGAVILTQKGV